MGRGGTFQSRWDGRAEANQDGPVLRDCFGYLRTQAMDRISPRAKQAAKRSQRRPLNIIE
ncbi:hypothetical protein CHELA41_51296 [Hyphomicrobiales bacterium]|nr:hypothetical protein CHELA41_51296 [Hyphomicrobiales bacterium]